MFLMTIIMLNILIATSLLHVNINADDSLAEAEWLGRALYMEHRVSRVVHESRDELKSEVNTLRAEVNAMHKAQEKLLTNMGAMMTMMRVLVDKANVSSGGEDA